MKIYALIALSVLCLSLVGAAWAHTAQGHSVVWQVIGSGGEHLEQGGFSLDNTLGQPIVGDYGNGDVALCVGFSCQLAVEYEVYVPLVLREYGG